MENQLKTDQFSGDLKNAKVVCLGGSVYEVQGTKESYLIEVLTIDFAEKKMKFRHRHFTHSVVFKDSLDEVLDNMGIKRSSTSGDSRLKAPMPGKVIDVMVKEGESVESGTPLLVLEAMKMENVLKSSIAGVVAKINVQGGVNVEKNQVLIEFQE